MKKLTKQILNLTEWNNHSEAAYRVAEYASQVSSLFQPMADELKAIWAEHDESGSLSDDNLQRRSQIMIELKSMAFEKNLKGVYSLTLCL